MVPVTAVTATLRDFEDVGKTERRTRYPKLRRKVVTKLNSINNSNRLVDYEFMLGESMLCDFCSELLIYRSAAVSCLFVFVKRLFRPVSAFNAVVSAASNSIKQIL